MLPLPRWLISMNLQCFEERLFEWYFMWGSSMVKWCFTCFAYSKYSIRLYQYAENPSYYFVDPDIRYAHSFQVLVNPTMDPTNLHGLEIVGLVQARLTDFTTWSAAFVNEDIG